MSLRRPDVRLFGESEQPPVLLLHPWWGVTDAVVDWAEALVDVGRFVVVPDLYSGRVAHSISEAEALQQSANESLVRALIEGCADELASARDWAAVGFSWGAFLACQLAGRAGNGPDQLVLFYGGQPPASPRTLRAQTVHLHVVANDPYFDAQEINDTERGFLVAGSTVETFWYDAGHWFAETGAPGYDKSAATVARSRVLNFLRC